MSLAEPGPPARVGDDPEPVRTVTRLAVVPVKGLAAVPRAEVTLDHDGVAEDRRLWLVREDGSVVTLRRFPTLVQVVPALDLAAGTLALAFPDGTSVLDPLDTGAVVVSLLFGKERRGHAVDGPAAALVSRYVGEPVRLVLSARAGLGWDEGPVSLLGTASAAAVGTPGDPATPGTPGDPATPGGPGGIAPGTRRYRMLVEVGGTTAHEEDTWVGGLLAVGEARLRVSHPLERCVVIESDPATGTRDWAGVKALARVRGREHVTLGVIATVQRPGVVRLGDRVQRLLGGG